MPNFDGGHYFLTVLAPIRVDTMVAPIVGRSRSHQQMLAQKLALMPTGRQTAQSPKTDKPSPFAANTLNHLARFVIIGGPAFNGRMSGDTLVSVARGINPLTPQPVDRLNTPYLLFAADIDAADESAAALRKYTGELWATMKKDLLDIFSHCAGFEGVVNTAEEFHAYILRCQLETTMPFNDYWPDKLDVGSAQLPTAALKCAGLGAVAALALWIVALLVNGFFTAFGASGVCAQFVAKIAAWGAIVVPLLIGLAVLVGYGLYRWILQRGITPFPAAPGSDLPSVLKALFVQQHFTQFAIEAQGLDDATLYERFGAFLAAVKPSSKLDPTQPPGEICAPAVEWVR